MILVERPGKGGIANAYLVVGGKRFLLESIYIPPDGHGRGENFAAEWGRDATKLGLPFEDERTA